MVDFPLLCVGHEILPHAKSIAGLGRQSLFLSATGTHPALAAVMELEASWFLYIGRLYRTCRWGALEKRIRGALKKEQVNSNLLATKRRMVIRTDQKYIPLAYGIKVKIAYD